MLLAKGNPGFTLVELLVVMAVLLVMAGLAIPALTTIGKSSQLSNGGRLLSNLLTISRSEAINQRTLMQLRVVTKWQSGNPASDNAAAYHKVSIWKMDPVTRVFSQMSKWEALSDSIILETSPDPRSAYNLPAAGDPNDPGTYFLDPTLKNTLLSQKVGPATVDFAYIQFDPTGAAIFPAASTVPSRVYLLLTEGVLASSGGSITYTHQGHPNWMQARVTCLTGRIQIVRP